MTDIQVIYEGPIVKRADAKRDGLKFYFTGDPCKNGHIDQRFLICNGCRQCKKDAGRRWRHRNPDRKVQLQSIWNEQNKNRKNEYYQSYYQDNKHIYADGVRNRRSLKKGAEGTHTSEDVINILEAQEMKCAEPTCGVDLSGGYHVDHIMPLVLGGSNWPENLQCLCPTCNLRKGGMHPDDWDRKMGRLV